MARTTAVLVWFFHNFAFLLLLIVTSSFYGYMGDNEWLIVSKQYDIIPL
jgi:hypothetical protein